MALVVRPIGSAVWVVAQEQDVTLEFSRITEHRDSLNAEVTVVAQAIGEVGWTRLNLLAARTRQEFARQLGETAPMTEWPGLIEAACKGVVKHLRAGQPPVVLLPEEPAPGAWLVPGLIPRGKVTVVYADGGTGKSLLALALGVAGLSGHALSPRWAVGPLTRVLYLDWEDDVATHQARLWLLTRYREEPPPGSILYRQLHRPLTDHADELQAVVAREAVDLVICDSLAPACGPEPEGADAATRTMMAFRALAPATILCLAHVSKAAVESTGPSKPFGSVHVANLARSTIEVRAEEMAGESREVLMSLYHRKCNIGPRASASALAFTFEPDGGGIVVRGERADTARSSLPEQILDALKAGKLTATVLAEEIGASPHSVRTTLGRMENRNKVVRLTASLGGKNNKTEWGLVDENRNT